MKLPYQYWQKPANELAIAHASNVPVNAKDGYIYVRRDHRKVRLHVWIWENLVGEIPEGMEIDHINGIKTDCRLSNLRMVTHEVNSRNRGKPANNTSGVTGVSRITQAGREYWSANWKDPVTGKRIAKYFSVKEYGDEEAKRLAIETREAALKDLIQNHDYTDRHGK
jgi:hypothetical protein